MARNSYVVRRVEIGVNDIEDYDVKKRLTTDKKATYRFEQAALGERGVSLGSRNAVYDC